MLLNKSNCLVVTKYQPNSRYRLICFPHAGGSPSFFRAWKIQNIDCEIYSVCYPGRAERINEQLCIDLRIIAEEVADNISQFCGGSIVLFGHSMGAVVALETARSLEKKGIVVEHLIASGSRNGICPPSCMLEAQDDETICEQLVSLGGTDPEVAQDPIFRELVLPSVRSDGEMFHKYNMELEPILNCSVTTIYGDKDPHADIRPWENITKKMSEHVVSGDHFYLINNPPFDIIKKRLNINVKSSAN